MFNWECVEKEGACITIIMAYYTLQPKYKCAMFCLLSIIMVCVICSSSSRYIGGGARQLIGQLNLVW